MSADLVTAFGQFGPLGLMIGYLVWREKVGSEKRGQIERERAEADKALASALAALTVTIQALDGRMR